MTRWHSVGTPLYGAYFNDSIASALGIYQDTSHASTVAAGTTGTGAVSSQLLSMIAYSALDSGTMPFGDTGIVSLFHDADILGTMQDAGVFTGLLADDSGGAAPSSSQSLAEIAVQFAGDQARAASTNQTLAAGAFSEAGAVLGIDIDPADWTTTFAAKGVKQIVGAYDLVHAVLTDDTGAPFARTIGGGLFGTANGNDAVDDFVFKYQPTQIQVALSSGASLDAAHAPSTGNAILIGGNGQGTITAGDGNNVIVGGAMVTVGNGDNIIAGSAAGGETITIGGGNNDVVALGSGNRINIEGGEAGISFIYAGTGNDTINFDAGRSTEGFVVLPVSNFSVADMLDLDQAALIKALDADPAFTSDLLSFESGATNGAGLSGINWTVIVAPSGQPVTDQFWVNGALPTYSPGRPYHLEHLYPLSAGSLIDTVTTTFYLQDQMTGVIGTYSLDDYLISKGIPAIPTHPSGTGGGGTGGTPITTTLDINGGKPIGEALAKATPFTVGGVGSGDTGTVVFADGVPSHAVTVDIVNGVVPATADLSKLDDGPITATLHVGPDASGNTFTDSVATVGLDKDADEQTQLAVSFTGATLIGAAQAGAVGFAVAGLEDEDTGSVTFADGAGHSIVVSIANGATESSVVDLSGLADGIITATLAVDTDAAGNSFAPVIAMATLDVTPPMVSVDGGGTVHMASEVITGTLDAGDAASTVVLSDNGVLLDTPVAVASDGRWSATVTLAEGINLIVATATNKAGDVGTSSAVSFDLISGPKVTLAATSEVTRPNATLAFDVADGDAVTVSDAAVGGGGTLTVVIADTAGTLRASAVAAGSSVTGSGSQVLSITGTVAGVNADLATLTYRSAAPTLDTLTITAADTLGLIATPATIAVTVDPPALPVAHVPATARTVTQGVLLPLGAITVTDGNAAALALGETFAVTVSDTVGTLTATAAPGGRIVAQGPQALVLSGTLAAVNAELASLSYVDASPTGATPDIVTVAPVGLFGTATNAGAAKSFAVNVDGIASVSAGQPAFTVDAGVGTAIPGLSIADASLTGEIFTVSVTDNLGKLSATGTGIGHDHSAALTLRGTLAEVNADLATLHYQAPAATGIEADTISIAVAGKTAVLAATPEVIVTIDPLPMIASDGGGARATVVINQGTTGIATVAATDDDPADTFSYSVARASSGAIAIDAASGALAFMSPAAAGSYAVTVAATDVHGGTATQALTVKVAAGGVMTGTAGVVDTFVFKPGFGSDVVTNFSATGARHGVLELDHALVAGAAAGETGADLAAYLTTHTTQAGADSYLHTGDAFGDTIALKGVPAALLAANLADIHFT